MKTPEIVPEKIDSHINVKILLLIGLSATVFQYVLSSLFTPDDVDLIVSIVSIINPLAAAFAGFLISYRYRKSIIFGKSYLFLSFGFLSVFLGEITYLIYDLILGIEPYPSIADVFFFAYSPLLIIYLIINIRFFQPITKHTTIIWVAAIPTIIILTYAGLSLYETEDVGFDFYYGSIFVIATSITLSFTILCTKIFKDGTLGKSWLILLFGILALTLGDDIYYYLEITENYDLTHPVNILWYAGYWIITYALLKHKEII
jgi:hypothetical protein